MFQIKSIIFAVVALTVTSNSFAKQHPVIESRIVRGHDSHRGEFPYYVFLHVEINPAEGTVCGGSLISKEWILTAAHCIDNATLVRVYMGSLKAWNKKEPERKVIEISTVSNFRQHPNFSEPIFVNDIGLIKLPSPVEFSDIIRPIPLKCTSTSGMDVIAIGNGLTGDNQKVPQILQYTELMTLGMLNCLQEYPFLKSRNNVICVNGDKETLRSICQGDSGGPLVTANTSTLVGISSFTSAKGCEKGFPQGFTRVSSHLQWIKQITGVECEQ